MADRITRQDAQKVFSLVENRLGQDYGEADPWTFLSRDNWQVRIGGWSIGPKVPWSRGFMISDHISSNRGHVSPKADTEARYEGRGWHDRMAADIVWEIRVLRNQHHVWCNFQIFRPIEECKQCRGLWEDYPYTDVENAMGGALVKKHFPDAKVRRVT